MKVIWLPKKIVNLLFRLRLLRFAGMSYPYERWSVSSYVIGRIQVNCKEKYYGNRDN